MIAPLRLGMSKLLKTPASMTAFLRNALEVVLVLALVFVCLRFFLDFGSTDSLQDEGLPVASASDTSRVQDTLPNSDYDILLIANPFSGQDSALQLDNAAALDAPETSLDLKLQGIRAIGDGKGVAFIRLPDGKQVLARVGVEILDGVEVEYVFDDRVTLRTAEGLETLYRRSPERSITFESVSEAPVEEQNSFEFDVYGQDLSAQKFISDVSMVLVEDNGAPKGYRLTPRRRSGALNAAGFQDGDILLSVNEFPVSEIDVADLQDLLLAATVFEFYVEREEKTERVIVEFAQGVEN